MFRFKKPLFNLLVVALFVGAAYGGSRLYYAVTHGFTIGNITSDFAYDPRWDIRPLTSSEMPVVDQVLSQKFHYLGKGCQSYVFLSEDGNYVLKFIKYQRFRHQPWLDWFSFIPAVDEYRQRKIEEKKIKREGLFRSWKIAFENLKPETGLVFVHLNKSQNLNKTLVIYDKMGFEHHVDLDQMEFLVQRRAQMLCKYIKSLMASGNVEGAKALLLRIIALVASEHQRSLADNDHALMQNTGVLDGNPVHIDVGQFVFVTEPPNDDALKQILFDKHFKFKRWLQKEYPELAEFLELQLRSIIGDKYSTMIPRLKSGAH